MRRDDRARPDSDFDALFAELTRRSRSGSFEPNCDVVMSEDGEALVVTVELAGTDPAELRVGVEERHLLIAGRRTDHHRTTRGTFLMKEIAHGAFVKKIRLPVAIAYEHATAVYRDGLLTIRLPVSEVDAHPTIRTEIHMTVRRTPV